MFRRWVARFKAAEATYGTGYIGLLPQTARWGNRTRTAGLRMMAAQSVGTKMPLASKAYPVGDCIQLLLTMIQNAESVVPSATIAVENR